jgi:hypothetical protein
MKEYLKLAFKVVHFESDQDVLTLSNGLDNLTAPSDGWSGEWGF